MAFARTNPRAAGAASRATVKSRRRARYRRLPARRWLVQAALAAEGCWARHVGRVAAKRSALPRMISGHFTVQAQERIVFGKPAEIAVVEEAERYGAKRVFVVSTRSLAGLDNGPLQQIERALGERHVGTCSAIAAHSPREDVIAAAAQARAALADLLVAVGGGSVVD